MKKMTKNVKPKIIIAKKAPEWGNIPLNKGRLKQRAEC